MASMVRGLPPFLRRARLAGLAMAGFVGLLLIASPATAAHPPATVGTSSADPLAAEATPPATPATAALVCLAVLAFPVVLTARPSRRAGIVAAVALLIWFAEETAVHSVHHLGHPAEAERCPVFSASQHLSGLDPEPAGPVLERPAPTAVGPPPSPAGADHVALEGQQTRAPPALPA